MVKQVLLLLFTGSTQAVPAQTDSSFLTAVLEERSAKTAGDPLFNGREHINYHPSIEGTPYYPARDWQKGTLVYQDMLYQNVSLKYDLVADELVVLHLNGYTPVVLFTPRVRAFTLGDRVFVNLPANNESGMKAGLYEELAKGNVSVYAKRSKYIEETIVSNALQRTFVDAHSYYAARDGRYQAIRKEKTILELMKDKRKEMVAWIKAARIKYKSDPGAALQKIVAHYNQLSR